MIYAVIDVGSNTIRLSVYKFNGYTVSTLFSIKETVGLAGYIKEGRMTKSGIQKACYVLNNFQSTLSNFEIDGMYTFATASLRNISNTEQAVEAIRLNTGIVIDVISGENEAILDFVGATHFLDMKDGLLVDIGGGSTELVAFKDGAIQAAVSIPIGSLNSYKQYCKGMVPAPNELEEIEQAVIKELRKLEKLKKGKYSNICGVGGTVRAAKKVNNEIFDMLPDNNIIPCRNIKRIKRELTNGVDGAQLVLTLVPDRFRTIVTGVTVLKTVTEYFSGDELVVSAYGVREGYIYSKILGEHNERI